MQLKSIRTISIAFLLALTGLNYFIQTPANAQSSKCSKGYTGVSVNFSLENPEYIWNSQRQDFCVTNGSLGSNKPTKIQKAEAALRILSDTTKYANYPFRWGTENKCSPANNSRNQKFDIYPSGNTVTVRFCQELLFYNTTEKEKVFYSTGATLRNYYPTQKINVFDNNSNSLQ